LVATGNGFHASWESIMTNSDTVLDLWPSGIFHTIDWSIVHLMLMTPLAYGRELSN